MIYSRNTKTKTIFLFLDNESLRYKIGIQPKDKSSGVIIYKDMFWNPVELSDKNAGMCLVDMICSREL